MAFSMSFRCTLEKSVESLGKPIITYGSDPFQSSDGCSHSESGNDSVFNHIDQQSVRNKVRIRATKLLLAKSSADFSEVNLQHPHSSELAASAFKTDIYLNLLKEE